MTPNAVVRDLGVFFDSTMTMENHVANICKMCYCQLRIIGHLRPYLTQEVAKQLVHSLVISRIDYCNSLLLGISKQLLNKLQRLQNAAARVITRVRKYDHITPSLVSLHWLRVEDRIPFKVLLLAFRSVHSSAPKYLSELLSFHVPERDLRSASESLLQCKQPKLATFGCRAFENAAPVLWNNLPQSIREETDEKCFKTFLKTYLFSNSYNIE